MCIRDRYISVPSSESLQSPDTAITMSAWINPVGFSLVGDAFGPVLMKSDVTGNSFMYRMDIYEDGLAAALNNWNNSVTSDVMEIPFNQWHHIAVAYCSTEVKFYLNNVLIGTEAHVTTINSDELPLEIGRDVPGLLEFFNGSIDDIRIYDRCITDQEISELFLENPSSIASVQTTEYSLSPNPASELVYVRSNEDNLFQHIQLVDMLGRVVKEQVFSPTNSKELNLSGLNKGLYTVLILDEKSISSSPLLIK